MIMIDSFLAALGLVRLGKFETTNEALENESYRLEEAVDKLLLEVECLEKENAELREMIISNCLTHGY